MSRPLTLTKWVGGKTRVLPAFLPLATPTQGGRWPFFSDPMVGGGALYFALWEAGLLEGATVELADTNEDLVRTYRAVRDEPDKVIHTLHLFAREHGEGTFSLVRSTDPGCMTETQAAARFLYLVRTGFNGLARYNRQGEFNTSMGSPPPPLETIVGEERLMRCSEALQGVSISVCDVFTSLRRVPCGGLVTVDPPYLRSEHGESFTAYGPNHFGAAEHAALARRARLMVRKGVTFITFNHGTDEVLELYHGLTPHITGVRRSVSCQGDDRRQVDEAILVGRPGGQQIGLGIGCA